MGREEEAGPRPVRAPRYVRPLNDPRNPALEAAIETDPDDREAYRVYADWLEEQGNIRAHLIRLQLANETGKPLRKLMAEHQDYLLGPLARIQKQLVWKHGFIEGVSFHDPRTRFPGDLATLLAHPSARFLVGISVFQPSVSDVATLAKAPPTLRRLYLRHAAPEQLQIAPIVDVLPQLHVLGLAGDIAWHSPALPHLHGLQIDGPSSAHAELVGYPAVLTLNIGTIKSVGRIELPVVELASIYAVGSERAIAEATWPALKSLSIGGSPNIAALAPFFERPLPELVLLSISGASNPEQLMRLLRAAPFAKQLTRLTLTNGALDDAAARLITREAFPALDELDASNIPLSDGGYDVLDALDIPDLVDDRRYDEMGE